MSNTRIENIHAEYEEIQAELENLFFLEETEGLDKAGKTRIKELRIVQEDLEFQLDCF